MPVKKRDRLTRRRVLTAAVQLADREGIEALSMRRLALELGVEAMSLYNHVRNKEDALDGMVEVVASEFVRPRVGEDWKAEMRRRSVAAQEVLVRHPWAAALIVSRVNVGPSMLAYVDATIGCLVSAGFSYPQADWAWNTIDSHIYGFTLQQLNFPFEEEEYADQASAFLPELPEELPWLRAMAEEVAAGRHDGRQDFAFGLEFILDGLDRLERKAES
jgi:AcrR family transcriptional regulator